MVVLLWLLSSVLGGFPVRLKVPSANILVVLVSMTRSGLQFSALEIASPQPNANAKYDSMSTPSSSSPVGSEHVF